MKILVIGASGTIGSKVVDQVSAFYDVIKAGKGPGDVVMDMSSQDLFQAFAGN